MTPHDIATALQDEILSGALPPGTPLSQSDLARQFQVSRIPIRDALAQLAADGLITASPNRTATVVELSRKDIESLYHMRILLEGDLLFRAVPLMNAQRLRAIDYALQRSSLEARQQNWAEGDQMFHAALYAAADSPQQVALCDDLRRKCRAQIAGYHQLSDQTERWLSEHEAIVTACHAGAPKEARRLLRRHLKAARNLLLRAMRKAETPQP
ncbi:GntR family transcriptional regulator [Roseovarius sp. 2305UL8-3]|uniref:GntR family transcriptional regulator n=1 Tax=Roseovarius conchicola TaxID=3121636 RepID=UPI00352713F0